MVSAVYLHWNSGVILRHWYAYHSDRVMGYTYASVGASQMYLTKCHPLALSDVIWVVEGDLKKPAGFR